MTDEVPLDLVHGQPASLQATIIGGATRWPGGYQLRGAIKNATRLATLLVLDSHLSAEPVGDDLVVTLQLTGSTVRQVLVNGYYDIFVSEPGTAEANSLRAAHGPVMVELVVTGAPTA